MFMREKGNYCLKENTSLKKNYLCKGFGVLAQLAERLVRNQKVTGSTPVCSTKEIPHLQALRNNGGFFFVRKRLFGPKIKTDVLHMFYVKYSESTLKLQSPLPLVFLNIR